MKMIKWKSEPKKVKSANYKPGKGITKDVHKHSKPCKTK